MKIKKKQVLFFREILLFKEQRSNEIAWRDRIVAGSPPPLLSLLKKKEENDKLGKICYKACKGEKKFRSVLFWIWYITNE
jgi:hypothetical protein